MGASKLKAKTENNYRICIKNGKLDSDDKRICAYCAHSVLRKINLIGGDQKHDMEWRCHVLGNKESVKYRIHPWCTCDSFFARIVIPIEEVSKEALNEKPVEKQEVGI